MALVGIDDRVLPVDGSEASTPLSESEAIALAEIPGIFETQPRKVWLERLIDANICAIPVLRPTEVFDEPQAVHNEMVITVSDAALGGTVQQIAPPIKHGRTPAVVRGGGTDSRPAHRRNFFGRVALGHATQAACRIRTWSYR